MKRWLNRVRFAYYRKLFKDCLNEATRYKIAKKLINLIEEN